MTIDELLALLDQAIEAIDAGHFDEAERLVGIVCDDLTMQDESNLHTQHKHIRAKATFIRGRIARSRGDTSLAIELFERAFDESMVVHDRTGMAKALSYSGLMHWGLGNFEMALEYFKKALAINETLDAQQEMAVNLRCIGNVHATLSNFSESMECLDKALTIQERIGDSINIAGTLGSIGTLHFDLQNYPLALDYFQRALSLNESLNNKSSMAGNLHNIGLVNQELSDLTLALEYYKRALSINEKINNTPWLANNLTCIGSVYSELSEYTLALEYLQKALALFESIGDSNGIASALGNIASAYRGLGEFSTAFDFFRKALAIEEKNGKTDGVVVNLGSIGKIYATTDYEDFNPPLAEEYLLKAISLGESINARHFLFDIHKNLADLYRISERWKDFAIHFEAYHNLEKEVASDEAHQRSEQLEHRRKIDDAERNRQIKLARFQEQEKILHNILPSAIAERMVAGETTIVDSYENVSVLFADIVGFTKLSQHITPEALVAGLSTIFNTFDLLADKHGCEKIKTIGDSYMVVAGMPERCDNHAERIAALAFDMLRAIEEFPPMIDDNALRMRIGIHSGRVVAGIIGKNKYAYDLWGDAVNTASRMESHGEPGKIHCTEEFISALSLSSLQFIERGELDIKGKGIMKTYFLVQSL